MKPRPLLPGVVAASLFFASATAGAVDPGHDFPQRAAPEAK